MGMTGHKRGCRCVGCSAATRKRGQKARKKARKKNAPMPIQIVENHGYENQQRMLKGRGMLTGNPHKRDYGGWHDAAFSHHGRSFLISVMLSVRSPDTWAWRWRPDKPGLGWMPGIGEVTAKTRKGALTQAKRLFVVLSKQYGEHRSAAQRARLKKRNSAVRLAGNPEHFPKTRAGRPAKTKWWILDTYNAKNETITTRIFSAVASAARETSRALVSSRQGGYRVDRVLLAGPYAHKPGAGSVRK
jgi:hypothetical protein